MENVTPQKFTIKKVIKQLQPTIKKLEGEDEQLANLASFPEWATLKTKIESRIESLERMTDDVSEVNDLELYGFKCMTKNILVDELQGIINDVEMSAEVINKKKKNGEGRD